MMLTNTANPLRTFILYSLLIHLCGFILFSFTISSQKEPVRPTLFFFGSILRESELNDKTETPPGAPIVLKSAAASSLFKKPEPLFEPKTTEKPSGQKSINTAAKPSFKPHLDLSLPPQKARPQQPQEALPKMEPIKLKLDDTN